MKCLWIYCPKSKRKEKEWFTQSDTQHWKIPGINKDVRSHPTSHWPQLFTINPT
jgi:hypothetical protein